MTDWGAAVARVSSFDLETYLIEQGILAPRIVCGSAANVTDEGIAGELLAREVAIARAKDLLLTGRVVAGANIPFDLGCLIVADPSFLPLIFKAFDEGRIYDIQTAQALDAIAHGLLYIEPDTGQPMRGRYSLDTCVRLTLGRTNAKENDYWRLRYALLENVPLEDWPVDAKQYPVDDAENTAEVCVTQIVGGGAGVVPGPLRNLSGLTDAVETAFDLHLGAIWSMRTDPTRVGELRVRAEAEHKIFLERFAGLGFFDKEGKENKRAIKVAVINAYGGGRDKCPEPGCVGGKVLSPTSGKPINCKTCSGTGLELGAAPRTPTGGVCADRDALAESGDADLMAFGDNEAEKILNTYLPFLESGLTRPIALRPNVLVSSMRTSYDGLIQLLPRGYGTGDIGSEVRPCFRARGAWCGSPIEYVFCDTDFSAIEMCTLAQINYWLFKRSQMMETINATGDPGSLHTALGARMRGWTTEEMVAAMKSPDAALKAESKRYRQAAKPINFGVPGGMGSAKLVITNRKKNAGETIAPDGTKYPGVRFCLLLPGPDGRVAERCGERKVTEWPPRSGRDTPPVCERCVEIVDAQLRPAYFKQWPEIREYFDWVKHRVDDGGEFPCFGTDMVRGGLDFTNGANHGFQNLAALGAKYALRVLTRECYGVSERGRDTPLWGTRPIVFVHDSIFAEMPRATAHLAGDRMSEVMVESMHKYVPDVTVKADPTLMDYMYKNAEMTRDASGKLVVWEKAA